MRTQTGFTLIELVMVIVILGILSAVALPRFVDLSSEAEAAAMAASEGAVKSAHAITIAELKALPTVAQLIKNVDAENTKDGTVGVELTINNKVFLVPTFSDSGCTTKTNGNQVACIGTIVAK